MGNDENRELVSKVGDAIVRSNIARRGSLFYSVIGLSQLWIQVDIDEPIPVTGITCWRNRRLSDRLWAELSRIGVRKRDGHASFVSVAGELLTGIGLPWWSSCFLVGVPDPARGRIFGFTGTGSHTEDSWTGMPGTALRLLATLPRAAGPDTFWRTFSAHEGYAKREKAASGSVPLGERLFTADSAWSGGFYELALEVGPRSDDRLRAALEALWSHPDLDGCYLDRGREPAYQPRVPPDCLEDGSHLLGVARLPNGIRVVCGSCLIREVNDGPDWLAFYLPTGSLGTAYPAQGDPFGTEADWSGPWRSEVDDWLAGVGVWVARSASFRLGLIGFEVSGVAYAVDIAAQGIPAERFLGYLWASGGSVVYHPRNQS